MKQIFAFVVFAILIQSCSQDSNEVTIIVNSDRGVPPINAHVVLYEWTMEGPKEVDTLDVVGETKFSTTLTIEEANFYRLDFARQVGRTLILDGNDDEIVITIEGNESSVEGSDQSKAIQRFDSLRVLLSTRQNEINQQGRQAIQQRDSVKVDQLRSEFLAFKSNFDNQIIEEVRSLSPSLASIYGLNLIDPNERPMFYDSVVSQNFEALPDNFLVAQLYENVTKARGLAVGAQAPDFTLPTPAGDSLSLSELRGNYVLLDFWAGWCKPCRVENPNVVRLYNRYSDKNFEILGVSLDRTRDRWVTAIEQDQLTWKHVSDLQYFRSAAAQLYQVNAIPATFLLDPEGKIIAKNLRGPSLAAKLQELFD